MRRRTFLTTSAFGAAAVLTGYAQAPKRRTIGPNEKINHACIGVGGMGHHDLKNYLSYQKGQVVAICDVDMNSLNNAAKDAPDARKYQDWRELLDKEGDKIDSVHICVPDHMHALIALNAIKRGKHVYCQKPLCHDVAECRALADAAKKMGVVTQLGTQHASGHGDRMGVHFLRKGAIGTMTKMYLCSNRSGVEGLRRPNVPPNKGNPPDHLNWDWWVGTAPMRDYAGGYHPFAWRSWLDFGTGWSGDIGCHIFDAAWKGFNLEAAAPLSVKAKVSEEWKNSPERRAQVWSNGNHITWTFKGIPASGGKNFTMEWFDGEFLPSEDAQEYAKMAGFEKFPEEGLIVFGTEGAMLLPHTGGAHLLPKNKFESVERPKMDGRNHYHHFLEAARGEAENESFFQRTGPMTETILLGTVAIRTPDTELKWDPKAMKITNSLEATKLLSRTYRKGWEAPRV